MEIKWNDEGRIALRLSELEWGWLKRELRKVRREPIGDAGIAMVQEILNASPAIEAPQAPADPAKEASFL